MNNDKVEDFDSRTLPELDRTVHDASRIGIMTALMYTEGSSFLHLQRLTNLSRGNLSNHLAKLEDAGFVAMAKKFVAKRPLTTVSLTANGRSAIEAHWRELDRLKEEARLWGNEQGSANAPRVPGAGYDEVTPA